MLIDSHVNLHAPQFAEDQGEVIDRARAAGIGLMVTICDRVSAFDAVHAVAMAHDDIWCSVGTHPHEAKENQFLNTETLIELSARPKVVGIGETGLDFFYDYSPRDVQAAIFRVHIAAARQTGLPLIVHTRDADEMMGDILEAEYAKGPFKILLHCYTSGAELARRGAARGRATATKWLPVRWSCPRHSRRTAPPGARRTAAAPPGGCGNAKGSAP
jgi:TatD DNase family protein